MTQVQIDKLFAKVEKIREMFYAEPGCGYSERGQRLLQAKFKIKSLAYKMQWKLDKQTGSHWADKYAR